MSGSKNSRRTWRTTVMTAAAAVVAASMFAAAQQPPAAPAAPAAPAGRQGGAAQAPAGRQGGAPAPGGQRQGGPPPTPRTQAPVDLTGNWVAIVTEDWRWRMMTPPKGDYASVPLNPEGRRVADTWDASKDGQCDAYGAGGLMRMPTRLRITWDGDTAIKIETDAGVQTRTLRFAPAAGAPAAAPAGPTLQGVSVAAWDVPPAGRGGGGPPPRWGSLRVVTTNLRAGWLRKNGVPYSENAVVTEFFDRHSEGDAGEWLTITTTVDDPRYLAQPFITSSSFKKEADGSKWSPAPCRAS